MRLIGYVAQVGILIFFIVHWSLEAVTPPVESPNWAICHLRDDPNYTRSVVLPECLLACWGLSSRRGDRLNPSRHAFPVSSQYDEDFISPSDNCSRVLFLLQERFPDRKIHSTENVFTLAVPVNGSVP